MNTQTQTPKTKKQKLNMSAREDAKLRERIRNMSNAELIDFSHL